MVQILQIAAAVVVALVLSTIVMVQTSTEGTSLLLLLLGVVLNMRVDVANGRGRWGNLGGVSLVVAMMSGITVAAASSSLLILNLGDARGGK